MSLPDTPKNGGRWSDDAELRYLYDDIENPSEVTIFSSGRERFPTEWMTADRSTAIPLSDAR